jgi:hypothetical protein
MKTRSLLCSGLILLVIASGCTSVKRFKSASYKGEDHSLVDMNLFGSRLDQSMSDRAGKNLWDLSASAQTQLIQILHERYADNGQFTGAMNQEYMVKGEGPVLDYTRANLQMVFTIARERDYTVAGESHGKFSPADRIEFLEFSLEIPAESNLHFKGWNRYATEYGEVEIAEMSFSRSLDLDAQGSGEVVEGSMKGSVSKSEDQAVRSRYLKLNGSITDHRLSVVEEGTREIDLAGNVIADISLAFDEFPERMTIPLYADGEGASTTRISGLKFQDVLVPRMEGAPEDIMGKLVLEYVYRHVESGWKTYQEWDDRVAWYRGKVSKEVRLFGRADYVPGFCCIGSEAGQRSLIRVRDSSGKEFPLQFMDYKEAERFFDWMASASGNVTEARDAPVKIGSHTLIYQDQPLTWNSLVEGPTLKVLSVY